MSQSQTACCVPGCSSGRGVRLRLHSFPCPEVDIERFQRWLKRIGGEIVELEDMYIYKNRKVCSRHFEPMYRYTKKLSTLAVPTLHLGDSHKKSEAPVQIKEEVVVKEEPADDVDCACDAYKKSEAPVQIKKEIVVKEEPADDVDCAQIEQRLLRASAEQFSALL